MGVNLAARRCPECGRDSKVYNSREIKTGQVIRFRECLSCGHRFMTVEVYVRDVREYRKSGTYIGCGTEENVVK